MKKINVLLLTLAIVFTASAVSCAKNESAKSGTSKAAAQPAAENPVEKAAMNYFADFPGNRIIPTDKLMVKMDAGDPMLILDIRQPDAYAEGHLKGAVNAPWGPAIADALDWLPDDIPVYVNCYTGQTAGQTVAALNVAGIHAESIQYGYTLGIAKTEGIAPYLTKEASPSPDPSGVKYDPQIKKAVAAYFTAIPDGGSNIWTSEKLKTALDAEDDIMVVSIRQPDAYDAGHIEGAINIPWGKGMQEQFSALPKDETVVVHCYSGQTAGQTVGILRLLGYDAVSLKSGMGTPATGDSGWVNEGYPVVQSSL